MGSPDAVGTVYNCGQLGEACRGSEEHKKKAGANRISDGMTHTCFSDITGNERKILDVTSLRLLNPQSFNPMSSSASSTIICTVGISLVVNHYWDISPATQGGTLSPFLTGPAGSSVNILKIQKSRRSISSTLQSEE